MHETCKCGFLMSDTTVPNHTILRMFHEPITNDDYLDKDWNTIFHCECCHRLHIYGKQFRIFWLEALLPSAQYHPKAGQHEVWIRNDYDEIFKGYFDTDGMQLFLQYHDKTALFHMEEMYEDGNMLYHAEHPERIIFDPVSVNKSVEMDHIRCSCGWMIAQEFCDADSVINLYDDTSWELFVKAYFGDEDMEGRYISDFTSKGLFCEKCSRLMLPNENSQYIVYEPIQEQITIYAVFSFLWYFVKPIEWFELEDKFCSDRESYQKLPEKFNRIYISEDKKHLRVHIGDTVVYYKAEKDE